MKICYAIRTRMFMFESILSLELENVNEPHFWQKITLKNPLVYIVAEKLWYFEIVDFYSYLNSIRIGVAGKISSLTKRRKEIKYDPLNSIPARWVRKILYDRTVITIILKHDLSLFTVLQVYVFQVAIRYIVEKCKKPNREVSKTLLKWNEIAFA